MLSDLKVYFAGIMAQMQTWFLTVLKKREQGKRYSYGINQFHMPEGEVHDENGFTRRNIEQISTKC